MDAALASGLNLVQFENDLDDKKWAAHIKDDFTVARSLGVVGVPTYFINGVKLESSRREDLEQVIITLLEND